MNTSENKIEDLLFLIDEIKKTLNGLGINQQKFIVGNNPIPPGIGCKFAYDKNGLILKADRLQISDIPEIPIDHITGLRKALDEKVSSNDIARLKIFDMEEISRNINTNINTGIKINYDEDGRIVSSSDELLIEDIPVLPITKIDGLMEKLELLSSYHPKTSDVSNEVSVVPGSHCKVTYDKYGRVISGTDLSINDIPRDLITRLNTLEANIPNLAPIKTVNSLINETSKKLNANNKIASGIFTKVQVDSNGLVVKGDKLSKRDLPILEISDIDNLDISLRSKANQDEFIDLSNTVSGIVSNLNRIGDISKLQISLEKKSDKKELAELSSKVNSIKNSLDNLIVDIPNNLVIEQLNQIQRELSNLSGRISVLENKLNLL